MLDDLLATAMLETRLLISRAMPPHAAITLPGNAGPDFAQKIGNWAPRQLDSPYRVKSGHYGLAKRYGGAFGYDLFTVSASAHGSLE